MERPFGPTFHIHCGDRIHLAAHIAVNEGHTAKELGGLAYTLLHKADSKCLDKELAFPEGSIMFWSVENTETGVIAHHRVSGPLEIEQHLWPTCPLEVGFTNCDPILIDIKPGLSLPAIQQYALKPEATEGVRQLIDGLLARGIQIQCQSPCNTPIFSVSKPGRNGD